MYRTRSRIRVGRRWQIVGVAAVAVTIAGVGLGVASASESTVPTVQCPGVAEALPAVPAQSQAEVERNLALLNTQIQEANQRLASTVGQGGPNFIQNAILGPLKDKRVSTIDRIAISIGRHAAKPALDEQGLGTCTLNTGGAVSPTEPTAVKTQSADAAAASAGTISCPSVADKLPAIPAQAQAEVERNLALLNTQIDEANKRLASSVGQGGANFVQNAILGPLKDKRVSTIDRIAISIGRHAAKPALDEQGLGTCTVSGGGTVSTPEPTTVATANPGGNQTAAAPTVNCPQLTGLPSIPAQAQAEVASNLTLLQTQINEANARLASTIGQGGPNFIQNAILGPLKDKRTATINRIATAIGRNAPRPDLNVEGTAPCTLNQ
jgi:phage-related protein